ncbi:MAG: hypothetical protein HQM12_10940 [SAR324 cluster bacterium]|nr:hypothetical protein [SAR324 cluster bacterium]
MIVTAWNNGKHYKTGAGYGFKFSIIDRDRHIRRTWKTVVVQLPDGKKVEANIDKQSFWSGCREIISSEFGAWLLENGHAPWPNGNPPKFELTYQSDNVFKLDGT